MGSVVREVGVYVLPGRVEDAITGLLPSACREQVRADLHEQYERTGRHFAAVLRTVPQAVIRQIHRTTDIRIFFLEAFAVLYSFAAAAARSDQPSSLVDDPQAFLRLAIPAITVLIVLLLRNAWSDPEQRAQLAATFDVVIALTFAGLSQKALSVFMPELALPRWRFTQGSYVAWLFLTGLRGWFPHRWKVSPQFAPRQSLERVRWRAGEFAKQIRQWNTGGYIAAGAMLTLFSLSFVLSGSPQVRTASGIIIAGAVYMTAQIRKRGSPASVPVDTGLTEYISFYRRELELQRTLLQRVWFWYFGSLIPGCLLLLMKSDFYAYFVLMYVFLIAELNHRAIRRFDREMDEINMPKAELEPLAPLNTLL